MKIAVLFLITICLMGTYLCPLSESFFIGDNEGDEIYAPVQVEEGPEGNIYIYDYQTVFINVFSPEGKFLRKMGGKGQGPGEIQRADGVYFNFTYDKKMLYFSEFFGGHRWITFMELSGKFHNVIKLKMTKNYAISRSIPLKNGSLLTEAFFRCDKGKTGDYFLYRCPTALIIITKEGEMGTEILRTNYVERISLRSDGADLGIPFVPVFQWVLLEEKSIVFTDGQSNVLKIYDLKGKKTGEIKTSLPEPQKVTDRDLEAWKKDRIENFRDKAWFARFGHVIKKYKKSIYDRKPNISHLSLTPDNHLLIGESRPPGESMGKYWLLDTKGNTLARVEVEGYGLKITKHFVFLIVRDEEENPLLQVMKRKKNKSEKESLLIFENNRE
ncbi:MAG: hypothetical protein GTO45_31695 [Candidatus Aminicenantes bacterium]|nr:hypothetical protein [Candidatus Aminicenantes bacterium]NIM80638.1 hypothetical protein [Candidatus Aminicenantes bacterium]NIN20019.1 hypothetical protein [Candidatus Aminicenantes bacterium]NIN47997.1 hypothetical protein [Candidatus Aminicenantes bacterium]NIN89343.1 hypothetical protein [Candidatus Aminicenantes bacterium]